MSKLLTHRSAGLRSLAAFVLFVVVACTAPAEDTPIPTATATVEQEITSPSPTPTQLPLPTPVPSPTATSLPATPTPTVAAPTSTPTATPSPTPTPTPTPVPIQLEVQLGWVIDFPNAISFSMETQSEVPIKHAELIFSYPLAHSCALNEISSVRIEPDDPNSIDVSWDWEMQTTGSIPPGTLITHRWAITDENDGVFVTNDKDVLWEDSRFSWNEHTSNNNTFYWYDGPSTFGQTLATAVENRLDRMELGVTLDSPIKAYIYPDSSTLREAILFTQAWTGGLAFTSQNILLIAVAPEAKEADVNGLVHELAHLLVREATFSCLGDMPTWLDEGLAEYAEGPMSSDTQSTLTSALNKGTLITIQSLSSSFPADHSGALLAYAQSKSLVTYLIQTHGWDKMNELLAIFKQGSTYEGAIKQVYNLDLPNLDTSWRTWLATQ